jgi:hypothetical protein
MDYFAGLDISMDETHVCVVDREGEVPSRRVLELNGASSGDMRLTDHAARSMIGSSGFSARVCHPSTLRMVI